MHEADRQHGKGPAVIAGDGGTPGATPEHPAPSPGAFDERVAERLRLLEGAFGASQDAIILTDCGQPDNPIVAVNPAFLEITGYALEEVIGRNCRLLQGDDRDQPEVVILREAVREGRAAFVTLRNYKRDGTLFWNELRVAPVRDDGGRVTHFVGVQNDITARVLAEQALVRRTADLERARDDLQNQAVQLADATQARDRFMAMVSHEMRTPVNAVLGYADLLELGLAGPLTDVQREYVARIRGSGRGLLDLVNDVLDLTRAEFGHLEVEPEAVDPVPVAEEVVALLEGQAQRKGLAIAWDVPGGPEAAGALPAVRADRRRLRQVLLNLVANAVKFTDAGAVTLRVRAEGHGAGGDAPDGAASAAPSRVRFDVVDTGIGIAFDQLPHVFDEFYQVDPKLTRRHGGAGLGLAISRRLARLMGGDLAVVSEAGRGSTFTLWLPVHGASAAPFGPGASASDRAAPATSVGAAAGGRDAAGAAAASVADEASPEGSTTVLVFGPDEATVAYLARTLYPEVRLVRAPDAAAVAALARAEHAALIVLDVSAEAGAGWQVVHTLREDHGLDDVPLLILPAATPRAARGAAAALDFGAVAFAAKVGATPAGSTAADNGAPPPGSSADAARLARAVGRAASGGERRAANAGPLDVLVVDDDPDARRLTAEVLQAAGAFVREAADGEAALAAMRRRRPDVAVVDLLMPVLDGFGVLAAMRADPRLRAVPVVVLTTRSLNPAERAYLARTAERVIEKGEYRLSDVSTLILRAATRR